MAFLSLLDDRARPKGSRDPLGFELIWSYFGRKVIGNLTTITSSMDNFAVAVLGFYWANKLVQKDIEESVRQKKVREIFLRYEQLTGYIRYYSDASDIMGITRIKSRLLDDNLKITLGLSSDQQILSDQASYGLWGLYSTAARDTGLVTGNDRKVTPLGISIAESIINNMGDVSDKLLSLLNSNRQLDRMKLNEYGNQFKKAIHHKNVQSPLLEALMSGNKLDGVQCELWNKTKEIFGGEKDKPETVSKFINIVLNSNISEDLREYIYDIINIEKVLVASNNIFHYCRRKDGASVEGIISLIKDKYDYSHLPKELPSSVFPRREQMSNILKALNKNDNSTLILLLLDLNKEVMQKRNGAPWLEIESGNTVRVKVKSETSELRSQKDIEEKWDYDYFFGSFLSIAKQQLGNI